jgi:predicted phosphoribosyltransferase
MFRDRAEAGRDLAEQLKRRLGDEDVVVLGLPRGGVPVAFEVARELDVPLDVIVVRKLGVPYQPELGMGAIGEDGVRVLNHEVLAMARVDEDEVAAVERSARAAGHAFSGQPSAYARRRSDSGRGRRRHRHGVDGPGRLSGRKGPWRVPGDPRCAYRSAVFARFAGGRS